MPVPGGPGYSSLDDLAYRRFGSGPDLLLVMGQDGSMAWWQPRLLALLAQHYRVTIFDLPGIGYSQQATGPVTLDLFADETAGLIQALSLSRPIVAGWGLGGDVAIDLSERHPASVGSLVLVDTSAGGSAARAPSTSTAALFASPWVTPAALASSMFTGSAAAGSAWLSAISSGVPDSVTRAGIAEEATVEESVWSNTSFAARLPAVRSPTLVIYGSEDTVFPVPDGSVLARAITGAQAAVLPSAGYASMFEDPSDFVTALEQFTG
jgi:pimeloyl-ACP methyl ester carboxylesterase